MNRHPAIGIVYLPCYDQMYTAIKGRGARLNGKTIKVFLTGTKVYNCTCNTLYLYYKLVH